MKRNLSEGWLYHLVGENKSIVMNSVTSQVRPSGCGTICKHVVYRIVLCLLLAEIKGSYCSVGVIFI